MATQQRNERDMAGLKKTEYYQSYAQAVADAKQGRQEAFTFLYENTYRDIDFSWHGTAPLTHSNQR